MSAAQATETNLKIVIHMDTIWVLTKITSVDIFQIPFSRQIQNAWYQNKKN